MTRSSPTFIAAQVRPIRPARAWTANDPAIIRDLMDPDRKRKIRLVVALSAAVLLAVALIYTSFSAGSEAREPSEVLAAGPSDESVRLTGKVEAYEREGSAGSSSTSPTATATGETLPVDYTGQRPGPLPRGPRGDRHRQARPASGVFLAEKDSLITKCPSKFAEEAARTTRDDPSIERTLR